MKFSNADLKMSNKQRAIDLLARAAFHLGACNKFNPNVREYEEIYTAIQILNTLKELVYYVG